MNKKIEIDYNTVKVLYNHLKYILNDYIYVSSYKKNELGEYIKFTEANEYLENYFKDITIIDSCYQFRDSDIPDNIASLNELLTQVKNRESEYGSLKEEGYDIDKILIPFENLLKYGSGNEIYINFM